MIWLKIIGWSCLTANIACLCLQTSGGRMSLVAAIVASASVALLCAAYGYQIGRDAAFADLRKFGRAFTRAKEP